MTSRERMLRALSRCEPDRVPYNLRPSPGMVERLQRETGCGDFAGYFGHDVRYVAAAFPAPQASPRCGDWPMPVPDEAAWAAAGAQVAALQASGLAVCSAYAMGVFEQAKDWLGDERALVAMHEEPGFLERVLEAITAWKCAVYGGYVQAGVDIVWIGDDLGTQRSLVMSPADYRRWYRPRHERIVRHLRRLRPQVRIAFHCCGHVTPLVRDLIEVGIDVLEAVQAETMDLAYLKRGFGGDLSFWGAVGAQSVLARTTPAQVREGVRATLQTMAPGGGYVAAPCHTLTEEVPWESILAFHEAVRRYGRYPRGWECP
ncbi:MAG: uroporphyrinogen decarboxylase family protein [Candidatus Latescibacterota bacterium]